MKTFSVSIAVKLFCDCNKCVLVAVTRGQIIRLHNRYVALSKNDTGLVTYVAFSMCAYTLTSTSTY